MNKKIQKKNKLPSNKKCMYRYHLSELQQLVNIYFTEYDALMIH